MKKYLFFFVVYICLPSLLNAAHPHFVLPSDNRDLSTEEITLAYQVIEKIDYLIQYRESLIRDCQIDPLFVSGDNFWKNGEGLVTPLSLLTSWIIENKSVEVLKNIRLFCPFFTGYMPVKKHKTGFWFLQNETVEITENFQEELEQNLICTLSDEGLDYYLNLIKRFNLPPQCIYQPPIFLGEFGIKSYSFGKTLVYNPDFASYQERICLMQIMGVFQKLEALVKQGNPIKVLEIGSGYGALAFFMKQVFPSVQYTLLDIPESLLFSSIYVSLNCQDCTHAFAICDSVEEFQKADFRYVPNYAAHTLEEDFDLVINTLSMSEMTEYQIKTYIDLMKSFWLVKRGIFFEQNQDNRHLGWTKASIVIQKDLFLEHTLDPHTNGFRQGVPNIWRLP
ncbi:MAG: putative sugar O-methyltransferase [Chlamydiales bacterium]|nr:putative sugar O-methyltransferase [Chlamydiales bacterium]